MRTVILIVCLFLAGCASLDTEYQLRGGIRTSMPGTLQ